MNRLRAWFLAPSWAVMLSLFLFPMLAAIVFVQLRYIRKE